jgi:arginyl-tRNA synthetase
MTQNIFADLRAVVLDALHAVIPDLAPDIAARVEVTPTRDPAHGDMATNAALLAAKPARRKPQDIAAALAEILAADPRIAAATPAGPGFVNLKLNDASWRTEIPAILRGGLAYGDSAVGQAVRVNVEYVSANPTGPMHIGHCRGAVVGDALANLLARAGYDVTKEFLINDAGNQIIALAWAAYFRYLQAIGSPITEDEFNAHVPGGLQYRGEYLIPVGEALAASNGTLLSDNGGIADPALWFDSVRDMALAMNLASIRADLALLGVRFDRFSSERELVETGGTEQVIGRLRAMGLIYEGTLEPPKGKLPDDWEPREQTLFRSTQFGDDVDRALRKSDGSNTYFANDISYHADKMARGAQVMIDVWGADHGGHVLRMQSAVKALGGKLDIVLCQIVHVLKDGEPVRMSKRAGNFITLRDLLDEVGRDAVRFTMLTRKSDAQMEFDIAQAVAQTRENPVFYVQYAHARCRSVLRASVETYGVLSEADLAEVELGSLSHEAELTVIRRLAGWPRVLEAAALAREPHRIAFFLYDLAADFHMLWNRGREDAALRFLQAEQKAETLARLALVAAVAVVIRSGLAIMGVDPVEEMR